MDDYEHALNYRQNWVNQEGCGEVTYVGNYCVITGVRGVEGVDEFGTGFTGTSQYVSVMYSVGLLSVMESECKIVGKYDSDTEVDAILNHDRLISQASAMDLLEFVYES